MRFLNIFTLCSGFILTYLAPNIPHVFTINLFVISMQLFFIILQKPKFIRLVMMWQVAFLYIIVAEGFIHYKEIIYESGFENTLQAAKYINMCNLAIMSFYSIFYNEKKIEVCEKKTNYARANKIIPLFFIIFMAAIFAYTYKDIVFERLRSNFSSLILYETTEKEGYFKVLIQFSAAIGCILPAIIAHYCKYVVNIKFSALTSLVICAPIFVILLTLDSRHRLFFSVLGFFLVHFHTKDLNIKLYIYLFILAILFATASVVLIKWRQARSNASEENYIEKVFHSQDSLRNTAKLVDHFRYYPHLFGKSMSVWFIFWVPRKWWPEKPTRIEYWLIRDYEGGLNSKTHSVNFSYGGDAYADFGFWGGIFFCCILFGAILVMCEKWCACHIQSPNSFRSLIAIPIYSFAFFIIKSFITAAILLSGVLFIVLFFYIALFPTSFYKVFHS